MPGLLYVNDVDVATLGLTVGTPLTGAADGPEIRASTAPILGRMGHLALTDSPPAAPRRITVSGRQKAATTGALLDLEDRLKRVVHDGIVRVRLGDRPDREWEARGRMFVRPIGGWQARTAQDVDLIFEADDPIAQAIAPRTVSFAGGPTECPLGTAVSQPVILIGDGATNPVVTLRDHRGQVIHAMGFVAAIGAGEWFEINCETQTIVDQDGTNQAATFDGETEFIELNPYHAGSFTGPWPTLEVSSGALATAEYRERYL